MRGHVMNVHPDILRYQADALDRAGLHERARKLRELAEAERQRAKGGG